MEKSANKGLMRLQRATRNSLAGLLAAWRSEAAVRQEMVLLAVAAPAALWLTGDAVERVLLIASVVLVLIVELLNTAVEYAIDRIGPERHELSGKAKDIGSAAVMVTLLLAAFVWVAVLGSGTG